MFLDVSAYYTYPKNPTIRNTDRYYYNCGGYALGKLKWYWPAASQDEIEEIHAMFDDGEYELADTIMVHRIMEDFPELIRIDYQRIKDHLIDYKKYEIIAFRSAHDEYWDFHFRKLAANGRWYEKNGCEYRFYNYSYDSIFDIWNNRYNGKIYFFMRERTR